MVLKLLSQLAKQIWGDGRLQWWTLQVGSFCQKKKKKKVHLWRHNLTMWILRRHGKLRSEVSNPTYLQIPIWSAFWRESLFDETFTRSCTYFHIMYSERQLNLLNWQSWLGKNIESDQKKHLTYPKKISQIPVNWYEKPTLCSITEFIPEMWYLRTK